LIYVDGNDLDNWELLKRCVDNINHFLDQTMAGNICGDC
jgi:hypothetical protein